LPDVQGDFRERCQGLADEEPENVARRLRNYLEYEQQNAKNRNKPGSVGPFVSLHRLRLLNSGLPFYGYDEWATAKSTQLGPHSREFHDLLSHFTNAVSAHKLIFFIYGGI
jgi:hypothetical protein